MQIGRMTKETVPGAAALEAASFSMPWSEKDFYDQLQKDNALYMTATEAGRVIGLCGLIESFGEADICNVSVDKEYQNRGIAYAMLQELFAEGEKRGITAYTLEVRAGNAAAIHLYEKLGFVNEGVRPNFYERPKEDAVIMWKRK